jgi:hypothetical protein
MNDQAPVAPFPQREGQQQMHGMHGLLLRSAGLKVIAVYIPLERTRVKEPRRSSSRL